MQFELAGGNVPVYVGDFSREKTHHLRNVLSWLSFMIVASLICLLGLFLGLLAGLYVVVWYIEHYVGTPSIQTSYGAYESNFTKGAIPLIAVDNYGLQKSVGFNYVEPKVSGPYYQWGGNPQKAGLNF